MNSFGGEEKNRAFRITGIKPSLQKDRPSLGMRARSGGKKSVGTSKKEAKNPVALVPPRGRKMALFSEGYWTPGSVQKKSQCPRVSRKAEGAAGRKKGIVYISGKKLRPLGGRKPASPAQTQDSSKRGGGGWTFAAERKTLSDPEKGKRNDFHLQWRKKRGILVWGPRKGAPVILEKVTPYPVEENPRAAAPRGKAHRAERLAPVRGETGSLQL